MKKELQQVFSEYEAQWRTPRQGAKEATQESVERLLAGETLLFQYHEQMDTKPTDNVLRLAGAVGQFDLGESRGYSLMHTFIPNHETET